MQTSRELAQATVKTLKRDYYVIDRYLGGLITVTRLIKTDTLHNELHIIAPKTDKVFLNGKEITNADQ